MNIFFTDPSPAQCAKNLDTKRVNKMILESCQMLATAINEHGGEAPYKSTHKNHPSNIWVRESYDNWLWLWKHMVALTWEYKKRRGKIHKSFLKFSDSNVKEQALELLGRKGLTGKPNCAARESLGISYKHVGNIYVAYQLYLNDRWESDRVEPVWD